MPRDYDVRPVHRRRYIEIDAAWWSGSPGASAQMGGLVCALAADGWVTAKSRRRTRLVRRFASEADYRAALAKARFTVAAHLTGSRPDA